MTLTEFLLARVSDDEATAQRLMDWDEAPRDRSIPWDNHAADGRAVGWGFTAVAAGLTSDVAAHIIRWDPTRVLAECAAKRRIVESYEIQRANRDARRSPRAIAIEDERATQERRTQEARCRGYEDAALALASVYADHPDFDPAWWPQ
jgi:hypothetical protein